MKEQGFGNLPQVAAGFIASVIKKMRYRKKVRRDVEAELVSHFEDALGDCPNEQKDKLAQELIVNFGHPGLLATLIRRGKKRCRPLWKKVVIRSLQVAGILVLCVVLRGVQLSLGTQDITVDYVAWLNELSSEGRDESQNAKPYFEKAMELSKEMPDDMKEFFSKRHVEEMSEEQREAIAKFLEGDAESLDMLRAGSQKPYYWTDYEKNTPSEAATKAVKGLAARDKMFPEIVGSITPSLNGYKRFAQRLAFEIALKTYNGNVQGALDDCLVLQKFGSHLSGNGLLIEQLVGIAIEAMALDRTFTVLGKLDVDAETLRRTQEELANIYAKKELIINLDGEKVFWYEYVQQTFTDDGRGNGRMLKGGLPLAVGDWKEGISGFVLGYPDRKEVMSKIERYFESAANLSETIPWELHGATSEGNKQNWAEIGTGSFLLSIQGPAHRKVGELGWRLRQERVALIAVLGVLRYKKDRGRYPTGPDELVEGGYISQLPRDFYSDGPMQYKITDDGFMLYSVGLNFEDNDGRMGTNPLNGQPRKWADEGDAVFWPVGEN